MSTYLHLNSQQAAATRICLENTINGSALTPDVEEAARAALAQLLGSEDRFYVVVTVDDDSGLMWAASRREHNDRGPFMGDWRFMGYEEADELAGAINADPAQGKARVVEVYRYENDPEWPES